MDKHKFSLIGTVTLLRPRLYPIDPSYNSPNATTVAVPEGPYPLRRGRAGERLWIMQGNLLLSRLGDGLFMVGEPADLVTELMVLFPSKVYGPDEWADFVEEDICREGHPNQRLRIQEIL